MPISETPNQNQFRCHTIMFNSIRWGTRCNRRDGRLRPSAATWRTPPTSDVRLEPPSSELDETDASSLILFQSLCCVRTWRHPQNRKYCIAVREISSYNHKVICIENMVKYGGAFFEICERTDKQTNTLIAISCIHTDDEVTSDAGV